MNIAECQLKINIGDAYKLKITNSYEVFGRIVGFDETSACYEGEYAIVIFTTPGGTRLRTGRGWLSKIVAEADLAELKKYEELSSKGGASLYSGLIEI